MIGSASLSGRALEDEAALDPLFGIGVASGSLDVCFLKNDFFFLGFVETGFEEEVEEMEAALLDEVVLLVDFVLVLGF